MPVFGCLNVMEMILTQKFLMATKIKFLKVCTIWNNFALSFTQLTSKVKKRTKATVLYFLNSKKPPTAFRQKAQWQTHKEKYILEYSE